ncbi:MAG: hypothetical protein ABIG52_03050 [Nanoarchaeota archaeon]|nr:hypothetical protein [Nanoarchaeota archaeon]
MKLEEILDQIFHLNFSSQFNLAATFLRFQEHYESPWFKGKIFTLKEYKEWYTTNSPHQNSLGKFTYYEDWIGFNIPSYVLNPFYEGNFDPLSAREQKFLDLFRDKRDKRYYVIGTSGETDQSALQHEIAHGLFYTIPDYKREVLKIFEPLTRKEIKKIKQFFFKIGYHQTVSIDEAQAYFLSEGEELSKDIGINRKRLQEIHERLKESFERYCPSIKIQ